MDKNKFSTPVESYSPGSGSGPTRHNMVLKELAHAEELRKINQLDQALLVLNWCAKLAPEVGEVNLARAEVYRQRGLFEEALADVDQAAALLPRSAEVYIQRGINLRLLKRFQDSLNNFNLAISLKPNDLSALGHRGTLYRAIREYEKSLADYNKALTIDPANPWLLGNRAETYRSQQEYRKALDDYNKVLQLNPALNWVYERRSFLELYVGELAQARADFDRAWRVNPTNLINGWMAEWTGMCNEDFFFNLAVEEKLTQIAKYEPHHYAAYLCRASLFWLQGFFKKCYSEAQTACEKRPDRPDAFFWKSMAAAGLRENEEALNLLQKAADLGLSPVLVKPLYWLRGSNPDFYHLRAISYLLEEAGSKTAPGPVKPYPPGEARIEVNDSPAGQAQSFRQKATSPLTTSSPLPPVQPIPSGTLQSGVDKPVQNYNKNLCQVKISALTAGSRADVNHRKEATLSCEIEQPTVSKAEDRPQNTGQPRSENNALPVNELPLEDQTLQMRRIKINPKKPGFDDSDFDIDEETQRIPRIQKDNLKPATDSPRPEATLSDLGAADTTDFFSEDETIRKLLGSPPPTLALEIPPAVTPQTARTTQPPTSVSLEKVGQGEGISLKAVPPIPLKSEGLNRGPLNPGPANSRIDSTGPAKLQVNSNSRVPVYPGVSDFKFNNRGSGNSWVAERAGELPKPTFANHSVEGLGRPQTPIVPDLNQPTSAWGPVHSKPLIKRGFIPLLVILAGLLLFLGIGYFFITLFLNRPDFTSLLSTNEPTATASLNTSVPVTTLAGRPASGQVLVTDTSAATPTGQSTKIATSPAAQPTPPVATFTATTTVLASSATAAPTTSTVVVTASPPPPTVEPTLTATPPATAGGITSTVTPVTPVPGRPLFLAFSNRSIEGLTGPVTAASWSRDGRYLATGSEDKTLKVWEVSSGKLVINLTPAKDAGAPLALAWSSDGNFLVAGWSDKNVRVFQVFQTDPKGTIPAGQMVAEIKDDIAPEAVAIAPGNSLITYPGNDTLHTLDYAENSRGPEFNLGGAERILAVNFSPDNRYLAAGLNDGRVLVWEKATLKLLLVIQPTKSNGANPVSRLTWMVDGKSLVVGSQKSLVVYRVSLTGGAKVTKVSIFREGTSPVTALSLSADDKLLAVGYDSGKIELWSIEQEKLVSQVTGGPETISGLIISSDSHQLMVLKGGIQPQLSSYFIQTG